MNYQQICKVILIYQTWSNQSMKRIESVKCNMIHEDLSIVIDEIQFEKASLIHEHYFVPVRSKGLNHFVICCITCGEYYCKICGKLIKHS